MKGKIFITSSGYDPEHGKHVKDPYLGSRPSLGACRPDIRRDVDPGDYIFTISGKVREAPQFIMGGFEVAQKIDAAAAYQLFPERRLHRRADGQLDGNVIVDSLGRTHRLDNHRRATIQRRKENYVVGRNPVALATAEEIARGRMETLDVLCRVLGRIGVSPHALVGRSGKTLTASQVALLLEWLYGLKQMRLTA